MRIHDIAFYFISFFLVGVFIASFKLSFPIILLFTFLIATILLFFNLRWLVILSLVIIIGAFYYNWHDARQIQVLNIPFGEKIIFSGIVADYPEKGDKQKLIIDLQAPYAGKILANLQPYPSFNYGDLIKFEGVIKKPQPEGYVNYLAKNDIFGVVAFLKTELIAENKGSQFKASLFKIKENIILTFQKSLAPEKSALLSGITIGERAEFSKKLKEAMANSGTTHIVALSGYNITIIAMAVMAFFNWFLRRRGSFYLTILIIIAFVIMAGAEASVVRAAIMGLIILLAKQISRVHSMRNVIAVAALAMVLHNPKVLVFDVGFQLSFVALVGIIYLAPIIQKFFRLKEESGFLAWRENLLNTTSAQIAVLPLIIFYFGNFSIFAFVANILILSAIPVTMFFGFVMAALGFISMPLTIILGWFANLFLSYELFIIYFFSGI